MEKEIAAYLRLSNVNEQFAEEGESNSITNQRQLIKHYITTHDDLSSYRYTEYVDDGYTGTSTSRPAFQRMVQKIYQNEIHCIIVKDLSRFSRDFLVLGDYIEQVLPLLGIRFIAINDEYDSRTSVTALETISVSLKGLVYDYYSKDLSKKRKASNEERFKHGWIIGPAPYGYVTNYKKHCYEVDPEAAESVKMIFSLAKQGYKLRAIADTLNSLNIPTPAVYNREHPELHKHIYKTISPNPIWNVSSVRNIFDNKAYTGTRTAHMTATEMHKSKKLASSEWYIYENAHEALVSTSDFELAHRTLQQFTKKTRNHKRYPPVDSALKGVLRCGHCNKKVLYRITGNLVVCPDSNLIHSTCPETRYYTPTIETYVYQTLLPYLHLLIKKEETITQEVAGAKYKLKTCRQKIPLVEEKLRWLTDEKRKSYEAFILEKMDLESYKQKKKELIQSGTTFKTELEELKKQESHYLNLSVPGELSNLAHSARSALESAKLTKEIVQTFVMSVYLYSIDDYRIEWKYKELFDELAPQLSQ